MRILNIGLSALMAVGLLALASFPADAGMLLKQKDTGVAVWERTGNNSGNEYTIGRQIINVVYENISTASTAYVVVPVSGQVTAVYSVIHGAITNADALINFVCGAAAGDTFASLTITQSGSAAGDADSSTGLSQAVCGTSSPFVLHFGSDGGSSTDIDATITIVVDPY